LKPVLPKFPVQEKILSQLGGRRGPGRIRRLGDSDSITNSRASGETGYETFHPRDERHKQKRKIDKNCEKREGEIHRDLVELIPNLSKLEKNVEEATREDEKG